MKKPPDLNKVVKKVPGRIEVLKIMPYRGCMVYIRRIDRDIFMYDLVYKEEIYSSYLIITPRPGKKEHTRSEINQSAAMIFAGAIATIDTMKGSRLTKKAKEDVKLFEETRKIIDKQKKNVVH